MGNLGKRRSTKGYIVGFPARILLSSVHLPSIHPPSVGVRAKIGTGQEDSISSGSFSLKALMGMRSYISSVVTASGEMRIPLFSVDPLQDRNAPCMPARLIPGSPRRWLDLLGQIALIPDTALGGQRSLRLETSHVWGYMAFQVNHPICLHHIHE